MEILPDRYIVLFNTSTKTVQDIFSRKGRSIYIERVDEANVKRIGQTLHTIETDELLEVREARIVILEENE